MATPTDEEPNSSLDIKPSNTPVESADSPDGPNTAAQPINDDKDEKIGLASLPEFQEKPASIEIPAVATPDLSAKTQPTSTPSLTVPASPTADKSEQEDNVKKTLKADEVAPVNTLKLKVAPKPPAPTPKGQKKEEPKEEKQKKNEDDKKPEPLSWATLIKKMFELATTSTQILVEKAPRNIKAAMELPGKIKAKYQEIKAKYQEIKAKYQEIKAKLARLKNDKSEVTPKISPTNSTRDKDADDEYRPKPSHGLIQRLEPATGSLEAFRRNPAANDNDASLSETPSLPAHRQNYPSLKQLADMDAQNPIIRPTFADAHPEQFPNNDKEKEQRREQASIRQKKQAISEVLPEQNHDNLSRPKVK